MEDWVKDLVDEVDGHREHLQAGKEYIHPDTQKKVRIIKGQYWGTHGLSNFWYWKEVLPDGSLGIEECGYGWA